MGNNGTIMGDNGGLRRRVDLEDRVMIENPAENCRIIDDREESCRQEYF
jgi:hypothetical protein